MPVDGTGCMFHALPANVARVDFEFPRELSLRSMGFGAMWQSVAGLDDVLKGFCFNA